MNGMTVWAYRLGGLHLMSDRQLPFLVPAPPGWDGPADVILRFAPVIRPQTPEVSFRFCIAVHADGAALLDLPDGVRVLVESGCRMTVEAPPTIGEAALHADLFGPAISVLWHQRGRPPLHAAVVAIGGRAVAVSGDSGMGKSTTAHALLARGHRLAADDLAIIDPATGVVETGFPMLKLWPDSVPGLALDPALRVFAHGDKGYLPLPHGFQAEPLPLAGVVVLASDKQADAPWIERLDQRRGAALLHRMVMRRDVARALDGERGVFGWATALAARVPVAVLRRAPDPSRVEAIASLVENVAAAAVGPVEGI